jgi:hypothetical protein
LNFVKTAGGDSLAVAGFVPQNGTAIRDGKQAVIYIGGVARAFTLDAKGKSPKTSNPDQFKISAPKNGSSKFSAKLSSADFLAAMAEEKLTNATVKTTSKVIVAVAVDQGIYTTEVNVDYAAKQGKGGRAKKSK